MDRFTDLLDVAAEPVRRRPVIFSLLAGAVIFFAATLNFSRPSPDADGPEIMAQDWQVLFSRRQQQRANDVAIAEDSSVFLAGSAYDPVASPFNDVLVYRLSAEGGVIYESVLPGAGEDQAYAIIPTDGGEAIVAGRHDYRMSVTRLDTAGYVLWRTIIASDGANAAYAAARGPDNSVYVVGDTGPEGDVLVARVSANGEEIWRNRFGDDKTADAPLGAIKTGGGGLVTLVQSVSADGATAFQLAKTTEDGDIAWLRDLKASAAARFDGLASGEDGDIWLAGAENGDAIVIKMDARGRQKKRLAFDLGGVDRAVSVTLLDEARLLIAGDTNADGPAPEAWLISSDLDGNRKWTYAIDGGREVMTRVWSDGRGNAVASGHSLSDGGDIRVIRMGKAAPQSPATLSPDAEALRIADAIVRGRPPPAPEEAASRPAAEDARGLDAAPSTEQDASAPEPSAAAPASEAPPPQSVEPQTDFVCTFTCETVNDAQIPYPVTQPFFSTGGLDGAVAEASQLAADVCEISGGRLRETASAPVCE